MKIALFITGLLVSGCASKWTPGPYAQGTLEQAKAQCSAVAHRPLQDHFYVHGPAKLVVAAALVHGIKTGIDTETQYQRDFSDCMLANDWRDDSAGNQQHYIRQAADTQSETAQAGPVGGPLQPASPGGGFGNAPDKVWWAEERLGDPD